MNYAVEIGLSAMSLTKICSGIQELMGGGEGGIHMPTHTHSQEDGLISLLLFFRIRKVG
jgi:hypothetical protein